MNLLVLYCGEMYREPTDRFVPRFTLYREYRTINLINVTYAINKYPQMYKTRSSPRNINMKSQIQYLNTQLYIITPPHKRVIVPEHKTRSAIPNIILPEMCLGSGSLPSKPDPCDRALMDVGSHTISKGRKGSGKRHLPRWPHCSPLPNPSPCDRTLGPLTPDRHLTENTIPL